jgi:hypothetical protein
VRDQVGELRADRGVDVDEPRRLARDVGVDQLHRVGLGEGTPTGEELEEGDAEGVEVGPRVDPSADPAGLLGRHVGQGADQPIGRGERRRLVGEERRDRQVGQLHLAGARVDDDVLRLDVLVDHAARVDLGERVADLEGDREEARDAELRREGARERDAVDVLEDQEGALTDLDELERLDHARALDPRGDVELVAELGEALVAVAVVVRDLEHDAATVGEPRRSEDLRLHALV